MGSTLHLDCFQGVELPVQIKLPNNSFFLVSMLITGWPFLMAISFQLRYLFKLRVPTWVQIERFIILRLTQLEFMDFHKFSNNTPNQSNTLLRNQLI